MTGSSSSEDSGNTHSVFLSHSGAQKSFVEQLYVDLEACNRSVFFDIRPESLPKGEPFPPHIFRAIQQCQVGVVVLSEDFFCSKWPIVELVAMFKRWKRLGNDGLKIMPIFLEISPGDCQDETNHRRWLSLWQGWAQQDSRIEIGEWEEAYKLLGPMNGFTYKEGLGEVKLRKEIVKEICEVVRPRTTFGNLHVEGRSRLCKEVRQKLNNIRQRGGVQMMGVYGVGGIGKTTLCKSLCDEFSAEFHGKVCHVELKEGHNKLELQREVLRRLTNIREKTLQGLNEDECGHRLENEMKKQRVFIAIDNVVDSSESLKEASVYLKAKYGNESVVIITARSIDQLKMVKIRGRNCLEMPDLNKDEARSLFLYHATPIGPIHNVARVEVDERTIARCLNKCYFGKGHEDMYHYHPLALEVLGSQLGYSSEPWEVQLEELDAFNQFRERGNQHPVFSILRRSFDAMADEDQLLFMDAAIFCPELDFDLYPRRWKGSNIFKWLSLVHGGSEDVIKRRLMGLKRKSVIEDVGDGSRNIAMHDLWREFAKMECKVGDQERQRWICDVDGDSSVASLESALESSDVGNPTLGSDEGNVVDMRFDGGSVNLQRLYVMRTYRCFKNVKSHWQRVRVRESIPAQDVGIMQMLRSFFLGRSEQSTRARGFCDTSPMDEVNLSDCTNIRALKLVRVRLNILDLSALRQLRSLEYQIEVEYGSDEVNFVPAVEVRGLGGLSNLVVLLLHGMRSCLSFIEEIGGLTNLQILQLEIQLYGEMINEYPDLKRLCSLRELTISRFTNTANSISGLDSGRMRHLRFLDLSCCSFSECPGLGDLVALEVLDLQHCKKLKKLPNLQRLTRLRILDISWCESISSLLGVGALIALEDLNALHCGKLSGLLDVSKLIHLQKLIVEGEIALIGVGSAISLRRLRIPGAALKECRDDLQMLSELRKVSVEGWSAEGLPCLSTLPKLENITIWSSLGVKVLAGLSNMTSLRRLGLDFCDFEDVSCVGHLSTLRELEIKMCFNLERLPDIQRLTRLESLKINACQSLRIWEACDRYSMNLEQNSRDEAIALLREVLKWNGVAVAELPDATSFPHLRKVSLDQW